MHFNSKKKIAALAGATFIAVSTLGLTGCGNTDTQQANQSSASTSSNSNSNTSGNASSNSAASNSSSNIVSSVDPSDKYANGTHHATLTVDGYDPISITLDADSAPITVSNFCKLANRGYYNGLTFYRFQSGFCMQGGTKGNTASGSDSSLTPIKGEFSSNGVKTNKLADSFGKGTIAMARTQNKDSATSTFFITLGDSSSVGQSLNGQYAAFGTIDSAGMETVNKIVSDHADSANSDTSGMGMINDQSKQAVIESLVIDD